MRVLEIKNNLVKIEFSAEDNLSLSSFVIIEDKNNPYVAQVMNIKADAVTNFAIVKLLFTFNDEGVLKNYNGTIPSTKAVVSVLPSKELLDIIPAERPLILGELAQQGVKLKVDKSILDNNLVVCSNNAENTSLLIENITKQLDKNAVIFDTEGFSDYEDKFVLGRDFKLPLNYDTINFIYDNDLEDVDATSKAIIQDIFLEVQEYIKTLPEGFLPFETFLNVVDQQYKETQITQLVLLKNKLLKYKELNVFAENLKDVLSLSMSIEKAKKTVIDISNVPEKLQREVVMYSYKVMNTIGDDIYAFAKATNSLTNKVLLKQLLSKTNVSTIVVCPHEYKYISEVKGIAQNLILFAPLTLQHDFASYNTFLNKLNSDEFIIYGAHTQNIPFIVELEALEDELEPEYDSDEEINVQEKEEETVPETEEQEEDNGTVDGQNVIEESIQTPQEDVAEEVQENNEQEIQSEEPTIVEEVPEPEIEESETSFDDEAGFDELNSVDETSNDVPLEEVENISFEPMEDFSEEEQSVDDFSQEEFPQEMPQEEIPNILEDNEDNSDDVVEVSEPVIEQSEYPEFDSQDDIVIDETPVNDNIDNNVEFTPLEDDEVGNYQVADIDSLGNNEEPEIDYSLDETDITDDYQEPQIQYEDNEAMIEQAAKDVDKFLYEKLPQEDDVIPEPPVFEDYSTDELTEDDLNLIGDLTPEDESSNDYAPEDITIDEQPPVVPIYQASDINNYEPPKLAPGDRVSTHKYGEGVVEKMVKYGNKMLCSIMFPNIGKRLIDPAMAEITKLS